MKRFLTALSGLAVALTLSAADAPPAAGSFQGVAGLQLYSLRESFKTDVPGSLDKVKALGFVEVETAGTYTLDPIIYRKMLDAHGFKAISGHFQYNEYSKNITSVIVTAKVLGLKYVVCPWIPHNQADFTEEDVHRAAADFNQWGEALKKEGITFGYHPHGYEFRPSGQLMHLKDLRKGAQVGAYTGHAPLTDDVPLGTGVVNWPAVLSTAAKVGVKHYFIEDESPTVEQALPQSLAYLKSLQKP
jgi:sugar phosphate isomerase/epimerase